MKWCIAASCIDLRKLRDDDRNLFVDVLFVCDDSHRGSSDLVFCDHAVAEFKTRRPYAFAHATRCQNL